MGTSLTGLTPATTYDALIKVGDNGPLSATLKTLSDGLGNDSSLSLSTTAASLSGTLSATSLRSSAAGSFGFNTANNGEFQIYAQAVDGMVVAGRGSTHDMIITNKNGNDVFRIPTGTTNATFVGNVGIGTSTPAGKLQVSGGDLRVFNVGTQMVLGSGIAGAYEIGVSTGNRMDFSLSGTGTYLSILPTGGITFNGDTAAANALDDYEEGTWTPTISFALGNTGITYAVNEATYTKIGRQVTVNGYIELSSKGSSVGAARIMGLPFTIPNLNSHFSAATLRFGKISFANQFQGFGEVNTTRILLVEITEAGVETTINDTDFVNDSNVMFSFTYFV